MDDVVFGRFNRNGYLKLLCRMSIQFGGPFLVQVERRLELQHRGRIDIIANILKEAIGGAKKTQIMYRCNLSFRQLQIYLSLLIEKNFLQVVYVKGNGSIEFFEITRRGQTFLRAYRSIRALLTP
jgi:predicted transcriptional regulator